MQPRRPITASLERRFLRLHIAALLLTTSSSVTLAWLLGEFDVLFALVTALELAGLAALPVVPLSGATALVVSLVLCIATGEPSSAVLIAPVSGLMLAWRRPRFWETAIALHLLLAAAQQLIPEGSSESWTMVSVLALLAALGVLAGRGLRTAFTAIAHADAIIAKAPPSPNAVRRDERELLAAELVAILERDLSASAEPSSVRGAPDTALHDALVSAVDDARSSLRNLRALVSTLRASDLDGQCLPRVETVQEAMEFAEDQLVEHGFNVELPMSVAPEVPAAQATILASFFREAAENIMRHASPGSTVTFSHEVTKDCIAATAVNDSDDASRSATPGTGLRFLEERIDLAGGRLEAGPAGHRWILRATLPLTPHQLDRRPAFDPDAASRGSLVWAARNTKLILSSALVLWIIPEAATYFTAVSTTGFAANLAQFATLITPIIILIGLQHTPMGIALGLAFGGLLLVLQSPVGIDAWLIAAAVIHTLVRLRGRQQLLGLSCIALYTTARVLTQPSPLLETLSLLQLAIPVGALAMTIMVLSTVALAKKREVRALVEEQRAIRQNERRALAGELHDVLAHHLSLVVLEAEQHLGTSDVETLRRTLESIAGRNQAALVDLSMLTFILREGDDGVSTPVPSEIGPTHSAAGLQAAICEHGFTSEADIDPAVDELDRTIQRTVVRILREAVTNALRYAKSGSHIRLHAHVEQERVTVSAVSDLGPCEAKDRSGLSTGSGLRGLGQRVSLLGGSFEAGVSGSHWVVNAALPLKLHPESLAS